MHQWILDLIGAQSWANQWVQDGMVCIQRPGGKAFELKDASDPGAGMLAVGCGGWDPSGRLNWVGIDLDVGHGHEAQQYGTVEEAIAAAWLIRNLVGGAAEIRRSKSGNGIHVRVKVAAAGAAQGVSPGRADAVEPQTGGAGSASPHQDDGVPDGVHGRVVAGWIAKWILKTLEIKHDPSVPGRQNLWFWAKEVGPRGFELVESCSGVWTPPPAAMKEPERPGHAPVAPIKPFVARGDRKHVLERAAKYIKTMAPAIQGSDGSGKTFNAAAALVVGFELSIEEAWPLFCEWNRNCVPPWDEVDEKGANSLKRKLREAAEKHRGERGWLLHAPNPKAPASAPRRPVAEPGGPETVVEIPDGINTDGSFGNSDSVQNKGGVAAPSKDLPQNKAGGLSGPSGRGGPQAAGQGDLSEGGGGGLGGADGPPPLEPMKAPPSGPNAKRLVIANSRTEWRWKASKAKASAAGTDKEVRKDVWELRELDKKRLSGPEDLTTAENERIAVLVDKLAAQKEAFDVAIPIEQIRDDVRAALDGWPQRLSWGVLFCDSGDGRVRLIRDSVELMTLLKEYATVKFAAGRGSDDDGVNFVNAQELFSSFCSHAGDPQAWKAVEEFPFEPPMTGHYCTWRAPAEYQPDGGYFSRLLRMFTNVDDAISRAVFAAAICTPFWGGDYGARPAIVFGAKKPRSGKTTAAQMIGGLCGEVLMINLDRRAEERLKERMLSPEGLKKRVGLIDNLKGMLNSDLMEELITTRFISGKVLGVGEGSRPNVMTYFITANNAKVSPDFTRRCFYVEFASPDTDLAWARGLAELLKESDKIVADILWILRQPVKDFDPERAVKSEGFGPWIQEVLARVCQLDLIADVLDNHSALDVVTLNQSRREDADQERRDCEDLTAGVFERVCLWKGWDVPAEVPPDTPVFIRTEPPPQSAKDRFAGGDAAYYAAQKNNMVVYYREVFTREDISAKWLTAKLEEHINAGRLPWLRWKRTASARGWTIESKAIVDFIRAKKASQASDASQAGGETMTQ